MIKTLLQYGFRYQWNSETSTLHSTPIPNDISFQDAMYLAITNNFAPKSNKHIGAYFQSRECEQEFITLHNYNNEVAYFPIEIFDVYDSLLIDNVFGNIQEPVMKMLKDPNCNLRLLIWFPTEGYHLKNMRTLDMLCNSVQVLNIPYEKIYFIYGDLFCDRNIHKKELPNMNLYGMSYFENALIDNYDNQPDLLGKITEEEFLNTFYNKKNKYYLYKNRVCRPYRLFAYAYAYDRDLLKYAHHSFLDIYDQVKQGQYHLFNECKEINPKERERLKNSLGDSFLQCIPKILDAGKEEVEQTQWSTTKFYQQDSHFSLVTETVIESGLMFLSEKTWKCIYGYHPFIIWGNPNTLKYLKSVGYKTFDFLWDESYDLEYDATKRIKKIFDTIEYICSGAIDDKLYSQELIDVLIHNHNNLVSRQYIEYKKLHHYLTTHNQ